MARYTRIINCCNLYLKSTACVRWTADDSDLESDVTDDDKRAARIFRYGRAPGVFRYGKRAPSVFRYGKRAPAVFRYGRRSGDVADDGLLMFVEPQLAVDSVGHHKRKIFRYGKRSDD